MGIEVWEGRRADVAGLAVDRTLPRRQRRTIGPWCFVDHYGPAEATMRVGPHPHIGLHTVTWLLEGEALHTDSLGSEQIIRPGQLNLMTAGHGIAHAEDGGATPSRLHGVQLWVAQPTSTRHGSPRFAHYPELPTEAVGAAEVTVLTGTFAGLESPAHTDWPSVGAELRLDRTAVDVPLESTHEHGVVVLAGSLTVDDHEVGAGQLAHVEPGRSAMRLVPTGEAHVLVIGGPPFEEEILMSWNFVARERAEVAAAGEDWNAGSDRFGPVASELEAILAPVI